MEINFSFTNEEFCVCLQRQSQDSYIYLSTEKPKTMPEAQVQIYTSAELQEFYEEGGLQGLVDID